MQNLNIVKTSEIDETFRVQRVRADFDYAEPKSQVSITANVSLPDEWQIGLIVGNSGTGKSTLARELFGRAVVTGFAYSAKSVIDDMPESATVDDIESAFYAVGFGSVPSWLKPYKVLSTGEKMRVDMARALLQSDMVVFDEFTSVVDRDVARTLSMAVSKSVRRDKEKKFVAVTCHKDVEEFLQPDWVFDTDEMKLFFAGCRVAKSGSTLGDAATTSGAGSRAIII